MTLLICKQCCFYASILTNTWGDCLISNWFKSFPRRESKNLKRRHVLIFNYYYNFHVFVVILLNLLCGVRSELQPSQYNNLTTNYCYRRPSAAHPKSAGSSGSRRASEKLGCTAGPLCGSAVVWEWKFGSARWGAREFRWVAAWEPPVAGCWSRPELHILTLYNRLFKKLIFCKIK